MSRFELLAEDIQRWSFEKFGSSWDRGPYGPVRHLVEEAQETLESIGTDHFTEELADCLIILLDANWRSGNTLGDLLGAAENKMEVNKARKWQKAGPTEPIHHIKE